jgi:signal transduction histidine kinase
MTTRHALEMLLPASPLIVHVDAVRIEQVLINLIENAIKYSPQGGPIAIQLRKDEMTHSACLSVTDHGIGIPDHQQAQIFGRFMRAENTQIWGIPGTGLGLYLCREVVELHQGQLTFTSKVDQGSTFVLSLPLEDDSTLPL